MVLYFWHGLRFSTEENLSIQGGVAMDNRETQSSGQAVALAFLGESVAGVVAGLFLASKSAEET